MQILHFYLVVHISYPKDIMNSLIFCYHILGNIEFQSGIILSEAFNDLHTYIHALNMDSSGCLTSTICRQQRGLLSLAIVLIYPKSWVAFQQSEFNCSQGRLFYASLCNLISNNKNNKDHTWVAQLLWSLTLWCKECPVQFLIDQKTKPVSVAARSIL